MIRNKISANRKGNLINYIIPVILAVICLVLLGYLAYSLYNMRISAGERELAEEQLDVLVERINILGKDSSFIYQMQGPCKKDNSECMWYLAGWSYEDSGRPEKCSLNSCICICKATNIKVLPGIRWNDVLAGSCQDVGRGICRTFEDENIFVYNKDVRDSQKVDNEFGEKGIRLNAPLIEVNLTKTNSEIIIGSEKAYSSSLDSDLSPFQKGILDE